MFGFRVALDSLPIVEPVFQAFEVGALIPVGELLVVSLFALFTINAVKVVFTAGFLLFRTEKLPEDKHTAVILLEGFHVLSCHFVVETRHVLGVGRHGLELIAFFQRILESLLAVVSEATALNDFLSGLF